ncbi:MAG TPA: hypothetical protein VFY01_05295 [Rheinheimera sp.]|nr:hypothetical protein [Rheinheimera sp.]
MPPTHLHITHSELSTAFKANQHDIYVLDCRELIELWAAEQKGKGKSQQQIETQFQKLTNHSLISVLADKASKYGSTILVGAIDAKMLTALATDMKRSGSIWGQYKVDVRGGREYISFKGRAGLRRHLTGTRYLASNTKLIKLGIGGPALKAAAKGGFVISVIFSVTLNSINWLLKDDFRWTDWLATVSTDLTKAVIAGAAGYLAGAGVAAGMALAASGVIAVLPLAAGIAVGIYVAYKLNELDDELGITKALTKHFEKVEADIKRDISDGVYYLIQSTGVAVRRRLAHSIKNYLMSLTKRPGYL